MSYSVRDGFFDVAIVAGPRVKHWPSVGIRTLSAICSQVGLKVGLFGGASMKVKGVLPLPQTNGIVMIEDLQGRIHRIHARSVVKVVRPVALPAPFSGWYSQALIPYDTAIDLIQDGQVHWSQITVLLGSGNRALQLGIQLLERGLSRQVLCVESRAQWGGKRFAGWEVYRRRFEELGGQIAEATPLSLTQKNAHLSELRLEDSQGVRLIETSRVISVGPFYDRDPFREYPTGSFLFEFDQMAALTEKESSEDWVIEEQAGRYLASKIAKSLVADLGEKKEWIQKTLKDSKRKLQDLRAHLEHPFSPSFRGKWLEEEDLTTLRSFPGIPQQQPFKQDRASLECLEKIACRECQKACPVQAIDIVRGPTETTQFLLEDKCIGCGLCVIACPAGAVVMIREQESGGAAEITFPWRGGAAPKVGTMVSLLNRQGQLLESGRVLEYVRPKDAFENTRKVKEKPVEILPEEVQLLRIKAPAHLLWEARWFQKVKQEVEVNDMPSAAMTPGHPDSKWVDVTLDGDRRTVREGLTISRALFETGYQRPGDMLLCGDGTCGLCTVTVDGVRKTACATDLHRGSQIRLDPLATQRSKPEALLCPCLNKNMAEVMAKIRETGLQSFHSVIARTRIGSGRCHGQICLESLRALLVQEGVPDANDWIDWRFPWADWSMG